MRNPDIGGLTAEEFAEFDSDNIPPVKPGHDENGNRLPQLTDTEIREAFGLAEADAGAFAAELAIARGIMLTMVIVMAGDLVIRIIRSRRGDE